VESGRLDDAARDGSASTDFVVRALAYAIEHRERSITNALIVATANVTKRFRRGIGILDTAITIAPLLGLLGTVTGMMHSFSLIGGDLSAPGAITGGIAEALIATAFGLMIAITCLVPYNYLNNRVEAIRQEMESVSAQLELLIHPDRGVVNALGAAHAVAESAA
jgi:biopolymer transport protein ExbB